MKYQYKRGKKRPSGSGWTRSVRFNNVTGCVERCWRRLKAQY